MRKLKNILLLSSIFIITVAFNFQDNSPSGWYQQFLPNINGRQIADMTFIDSLTGYIVTTRLASPDTSYILKTTNGGDNWNINYTATGFIFNRIQFINQTTGFVGGSHLIKTTNSGANWFYVSTDLYFEDFFAQNSDTLFFISSESLTGGVYRSTNTGTNWVKVLNTRPNHIYFYNKDIGFAGGGELYKTTNGGVTWFNTFQTSFFDMHFINETTGWKCYGPIQKTTDGGLSWVQQTLPTGNYILQSAIISFSALNKDTLWGGGGYVQYPNFTRRAMIYTTTNGGTNWLYQVPDTSIVVYRYNFLNFLNKLTGWAYGAYSGIHTKIGGDPLTAISPVTSQIPQQYNLYQNYPNPFNPNTAIAYQISKASYINIKVFNIQGKETAILVNERKSAGSYELNFNAQNLTSGIYFYSLSIDGKPVETKKMMLVK